MPVYDYRCQDCGNQFEALKAVADRERHTCDTCGGEAHLVVLRAPHLSYKIGVDPDFVTFGDKWAKIQEQKARSDKLDSENTRYGGNTDDGVKLLRDLDQERGT